MDELEALGRAVQRAERILDEAALEPEVGRGDWGDLRPRLRFLSGVIDDEIDAKVSGVLASLDVDDEMRGWVRDRVGTVLGAAAALAHASGDSARARRLWTRGLEVAGLTGVAAELVEAAGAPDAYTALVRARWLRRQGRGREADRALRAIGFGAPAVLRRAARRERGGPRPVESPPLLFRLNGCGAGLYGARDEAADGSYVATYCVSFLWIPVFPIAAYRVQPAGPNAYRFEARVPLSGFANACRALMAVAAIAMVVVGLGRTYLESPGRLARVGLERARGVEASGNREAALAAYREFAHTHTGQADVTPAGDAVVRLAGEGVRSPCTPDQLEAVGRVVTSFYDLPDGARQGPAATRLTSRLLAWAGELGEADAKRAEAALAVLDMAGRVAEAGPARAEAEVRSAALRRSLADRLAGERPLRALANYVRLPHDAQAIAAAGAIVDSFGDAPSLWSESEAQVIAWLEASSRVPSLAASRSAAEARLARAREVQAADAKLAESGGEAELAAALSLAPGHQELAVGLANARRARGDAKGAAAVLGALGPPGRLTAEATRMLAACLADAGDLAQADALLTALVDDRLAAFQQAQREYTNEVDRARRRLITDLSNDHAPPDLRARLAGASDEAQGEMLRAWLSEQIDNDKALGRLRGDYLREGVVVPASIELGTLRLRRAGGASGEAKRALLAGAERAFFAIRQEAEGSPDYHLTLGKIYYRLGRVDEAKREFQDLVDRGHPALTLMVAGAQRELGLVAQAKKLAEGLYASGAPEALKYEAASLLAHMAGDLDEASKWAGRGDPKDGPSRLFSRSLEARRLLRAGKASEADGLFAEVCRAFERDAKHNAVAANNAAVNCGERYRASGDPAHLRTSVRWLIESERLEPQSPLSAGNLAESLEHLGAVSMLDAWVRTRALQLSSGEVASLVDSLVSGPLRAEVSEAARRDPSLRAAIERARKIQALAPQNEAGYRHEETCLFWTNDLRGVAELAARLTPSPVDFEHEADERRAYERGDKDGELRAATAEYVERSRARLGRVRALGHAPTLAAAAFLHGEALRLRATVDPAPALLDEMAGAYREAAGGWPAAGFDEDLRQALLAVAAVRASEGSSVLREAWLTGQRRSSFAMALSRAARGPGGPEALAALRARPELAEAVRSYKAAPSARPSMSDWLLAELAGDAEMARAASAVFDRADLGARRRIAVALAPGEEREREELALFERRGAP